jgi:hypothetical protein
MHERAANALAASICFTAMPDAAGVEGFNMPWGEYASQAPNLPFSKSMYEIVVDGVAH